MAAIALGQFRAHTDFGPRADDFTGVVVGDLGTQHNRCVPP